MDEPGNGDRDSGPPRERDPEERDPLDRLIELIGPRVDDVRALLEDATSRWRGDAVRVGEGTRQRLQDVLREMGVVTRRDWDELELRVAQIEHRLRLLENREDESK
jgi:BMFP domain-containing protein YqiC